MYKEKEYIKKAKEMDKEQNMDEPGETGVITSLMATGLRRAKRSNALRTQPALCTSPSKKLWKP